MIGLDEVVARLLQRPARALDGDEFQRAAVAAVFREGDSGAELLFIRRAHHPRDPWSGQIGFPGGRRDPHDADLVATARREAREELDLDLDAADALGALDDLQARARRPIDPLAIRPHAWAWRGEAPSLRPDAAEVATAFWVPLATLADPTRRRWYDAERAGLGLQFPAVDLGGEPPLWGLTHRMVFEILERLRLVESADAATVPRPR